MPNAPLTADQLTTIRNEYLSDVKEDRREWGPSVVVAVEAVPGAVTLAVSGLVGPLLRRRTKIVIWAGGTSSTHDVLVDVSVVAGAATVAISPVLQLTAAAGSRVEAQPYLKGPWAHYHGQTYFTDDEIQSIAMNALGRWGETIKRSGTPDETLFRAVRTLAFERMLGDDDYIDAMAADDRGTALSEKIKAKRDLGDRDRALFKHPTSRSVNFSVEI